MTARFYAELLNSAEAAGLTVDQAADVIRRWTEESMPYGDEWINEIRMRMFKLVASTNCMPFLSNPFQRQWCPWLKRISDVLCFLPTHADGPNHPCRAW
jgi:hypothetical protein